MTPLDPDAIRTAASELGVRLSKAQSRAMARYAGLLLRWNAVHNLTAFDSPADVLTHHLLDSLAILPEVLRISNRASMRVLDVGSGGGLPGIPLAIAAAQLHVTLVDRVQKKVAFLTQVKLELQLTNVECVHGRVETLRPEGRFDVIVARAFGSLTELVRLTRYLLVQNGAWCAMKGVLPQAELTELSDAHPDLQATSVRLKVPRLEAKRHLIVIRAAGAN